ncbi:MAG: M1 family metallopeptidase [Bacteroidia bacterium]|nr:M1 family metallopeptidase [Bacteroidia bacterium]
MSKRIFFLSALVIIASCKSTKQTTNKVENLPEVKIEASANTFKSYHASNAMSSDLVHTKLVVYLDWGKKQLNGQATITLKPHFYPVSSVYLNARGMDILSVKLLEKNNQFKGLQRTYVHDSLNIILDKQYTLDETYTLWIEYNAKPEELEEGGSDAISSDKGLYFINADGAEPDKPKQIWTQGETQSNSVWFPTIDSPNQRMTQEIYITVDTIYKTLSNGLLIYSTDNHDGTRTDYWKQSLPAAPYLTMMAVGKYSIVKDHWRNIDVNYYVEPAYEKYAMMIFGHTPEMMEFFSKTLGVDYPWEKLSQVVARDYVSGAMENASAILHGEFIQRDDREYLDETYEDVISHELFHQWFGDLVTCESWSNIPLNESFATYGEYLWNEHKYGRETADKGLQNDLGAYLREAQRKQVNLIRFEYEDREDMFDRHSYQKGGCVLHMLRKYVGDEAFFASLKEYLNTNRWTAVEIHNLRIAFEKVTGEDLNWFFNQWFLDKGHPELEINYEWSDSLKQQKVIIEQKQVASSHLFRIPLDIDIYVNGKVEHHRIVDEEAKQEFTFSVLAKPDLVNVDAEKMLVCSKKDNKPLSELIYQYYHAPLYLDRYEALQKAGSSYASDSEAAKMTMDALKDKYWNIRILAIKNIAPLAKKKKEQSKAELIRLATKDEKSAVRSAAIEALEKYFTDDDLITFFREKTNDLSYDVSSRALNALAKLSPDEGLKFTSSLENSSNEHILTSVADIYAEHGTAKNAEFFQRAYSESKGFTRYEILMSYGAYLRKADTGILSGGINFITDKARTAEPWWLRLSAMNALTDIAETLEKKSNDLSQSIKQLKKTKQNEGDLAAAQHEALTTKKLYAELLASIEDIRKKETNKRLVKIYRMKG